MKFVPVQTNADFKLIEKLALSIWSKHYIPITGKAQVEYMLNKYQSLEAICKQIRDENFLYYIIVEDQINIGYIGIQKQGNKLLLSKFYVKSSERGKGYGKKTILFIENRAREMKLDKVTLTVNKNNYNSINAYKKMGFNCVDSIIKDIGNGFVMDDFIMEKVIQ